MRSKPTEDTDPRHVARAADEAKQAEQAAAMAAFEEQNAAAARQALADQAYYEVHGIRRVEGKP
jgi:hypothetical protein